MYKETTGKVVQLLATKYGKTKSGNDYACREYLMEVNGGSQWVHNVKFSMSSFDGPIQNPIQVGDVIRAGLNISARQYNGKWFNDVTLQQWEKLE